MPIQLDTSRALRTHDELVELVKAVVAADSGDEGLALEWKAGYDNLLSKEASFALARAILGFANRPVTVARAHFEGLGYVIVGAEPGAIHGQVVPDSAELLNAIRRYTGHGHPSWDARTVSIDGTPVLVISAEAPSNGDRFALLRKSFHPSRGPGAAEGTIYIRKSGASERATYEDIEMLQDRLLNGATASSDVARREVQCQRQRDLIAEMVQAADRWVNSLQILALATAGEHWTQSDLSEWVNTNSGRNTGSDAQVIATNARKLRLETTHPELLSALEAAQALMNKPEVFDPLWAGTAHQDDARSAAYMHLNAIRRAFLALEKTGTEILASPPPKSFP